jgi:hypothetical protein
MSLAPRVAKPTQMTGCDPKASKWGRLRGVCIRLCSHQQQKLRISSHPSTIRKDGIIGEPTRFLRAMIERLRSGALQIRPRIVGFCHRVEGHIGRAMKAVERIRAEVDGNLKPKDKIQMAPYHRPELDETPELENKRATIYKRANRDPMLGLQA